MRALIVLLMTAAFAMCAAWSIGGSPGSDADDPILDAIGQPLLTQQLILEFGDSVEAMLGVTLDEEQRDELHWLVVQAWRFRDTEAISLVVENVDAWRPMRELPPRELAELAQRLRPQTLAQLRSDHSEIERWMLGVHAAAAKAAAGKGKSPPDQGP